MLKLDTELTSHYFIILEIKLETQNTNQSIPQNSIMIFFFTIIYNNSYKFINFKAHLLWYPQFWYH